VAILIRISAAVKKSTVNDVFVKDLNGVYQFVNSTFCKDLGVDKNEVIGKDEYFVLSAEVAKE